MATKARLPSTAVGRRRLLKLAGLLDADAKNKKGIRFDLGQWGTVAFPEEPMSCGTVACAMGLAVASEAFVQSGLLPSTGGDLTPRFRPKGKRKIRSNFDAAAGLFQIEYGQAHNLFAASSYGFVRIGARSERAVAKRIRDFVAGKAAP